jgi:transposase-like protein
MKKSPKFSPEVRERAVRMVLAHRGEHSDVSSFARAFKAVSGY